jgi:hypothetical protein
MTLRVFVGSSGEAKPIVEALLIALREEEGINLIPWYDDVFVAGHSYLAALHSLLEKVDAALIVLTGDDIVVSRQVHSRAPRDNAIYEAGFFGAAFGYDHPIRCTLLIISDDDQTPLKLPSDVSGHTHIQIKPIKNPEGQLDVLQTRTAIRLALKEKWIPHLHSCVNSSRQLTPSEIRDVLRATLDPLFSQTNRRPHEKAIDVLESALRQIRWNNGGIDEDYISNFTKLLFRHDDIVAMYAVDTLGPDGWMNPLTYRYLAIQLRHYVLKNVKAGKWNLRISRELGAAIDNAISRAKSSGLTQSETLFDNPDTLSWAVGKRNLEYSRILLWSRDQLKSQVGASVIEIHHMFHVPLFYLETPPGHNARQLDYVFFEDSKGVVGGFYGRRERNYTTESFSNKTGVPGHEPLESHYRTLLRSTNLMFAADAFRI